MSDVQDHMDYSRNAVFSSDGTPLFVTEPSLRASATWAPALLSFEWVARHANAAKRRFDARVEGTAFARDLDRYAWALDGGPEMDTEVKATLAPVADLQRLLEHYGIPFVLATYPQPWQVSADATPLPPIREQFGIGQNTVHLNDRPFRKLDAFAAEHDLPFVNATSAFRSAAKPAGLFLANDFHFSPPGHDLYAEVLATYIIQHSLVSSRLESTTNH
jgi:hypothetical protein